MKARELHVGLEVEAEIKAPYSGRGASNVSASRTRCEVVEVDSKGVTLKALETVQGRGGATEGKAYVTSLGKVLRPWAVVVQERENAAAAHAEKEAADRLAEHAASDAFAAAYADQVESLTAVLGATGAEVVGHFVPVYVPEEEEALGAPDWHDGRYNRFAQIEIHNIDRAVAAWLVVIIDRAIIDLGASDMVTPLLALSDEICDRALSSSGNSLRLRDAFLRHEFPPSNGAGSRCTLRVLGASKVNALVAAVRQAPQPLCLALDDHIAALNN